MLRLTSTASAVSGVSGFSDDFQDGEEVEDGGLRAKEGTKESREYGSIAASGNARWEKVDLKIHPAVYWRYLRAGGIPLLAFFLTLSLGLQTAKVYLDFLLRDLVQDDNPNLVQFFQLFGSLSAGVIGLTYLYNILGQVDI